VLGASSLTYAEATWTQGLSDWIGAHVRMFRFWDAAPRLLVPDNLKSGVHKASFYDPEINRSYGAMASHYGVGILPTRPYRPKDKAKVEAGVRIAQFYILGRLRNLTFFSLAECNAAIIEILAQLNDRPMRRLGVSRRQLFDTVERPAMRPLPETDHEFAEWALARVGVARRYGGPRHSTLPEHMPSAHRRYADWSPGRLPCRGGGLYSVPHALIREQVACAATRWPR
jgi:transposase